MSLNIIKMKEFALDENFSADAAKGKAWRGVETVTARHPIAGQGVTGGAGLCSGAGDACFAACYINLRTPRSLRRI